MAVKDRGNVRIQAVGRALDLLESIAEHRELGVTELARMHQLATSTVHNLLHTLGQWSYVVSSGGRYRLGPAVLVLTSKFDPSRTLAEAIRPSVERLTAATGHSANATTLVGTAAVLVSGVEGTGEIAVRSAVSLREHPLSLATGRTLVAMGQQAEWDKFIQDGRDYEPDWSAARWTQELRLIATTGLCVRRRPPKPSGPPEVTAIAVPVWVSPSASPYSIGVSLPWTLTVEEITPIIDILWAETQRLSAELGCPELPFEKPVASRGGDRGTAPLPR